MVSTHELQQLNVGFHLCNREMFKSYQQIVFGPTLAEMLSCFKGRHFFIHILKLLIKYTLLYDFKYKYLNICNTHQNSWHLGKDKT